MACSCVIGKVRPMRAGCGENHDSAAYLAAGAGCQLCTSALRLCETQGPHRFLGHEAEPNSLMDVAKRSAREKAVMVLMHSNGLLHPENLRNVKSKFPSLPILLVAPGDLLEEGDSFLKAGSNGLLICTDPLADWTAAIRALCKGEVFVSPSLMSHVLERLLRARQLPGSRGVEGLTNREYAVFELIGSGFRTPDIAKRLGVSTKTIESHREKIKHRLGLSDSSALTRFAVAFAQKHTIVTPEAPGGNRG